MDAVVPRVVIYLHVARLLVNKSSRYYILLSIYIYTYTYRFEISTIYFKGNQIAPFLYEISAAIKNSTIEKQCYRAVIGSDIYIDPTKRHPVSPFKPRTRGDYATNAVSYDTLGRKYYIGCDVGVTVYQPILIVGVEEWREGPN